MSDIPGKPQIGKNGGAMPSDPQSAAQAAMRPKLPKRFYKNVRIVRRNGETYRGNEQPNEQYSEFEIHLDGRALKTPARNILVLPNENSASIVGDEWLAQKDIIDAATMPATRMVNTAIDGIGNDPQAVMEDMLKFASSDLLCYRAASPQGLVDLQRQHWDPVLDWAHSALDARFEITEGLVHIAQPKKAVQAIGISLKKWSHPIAVTALHTFTSLTGSLILAVAIAQGRYDAVQAWKIAHLEEDWNISTWGEDHEAQKRRDNRWKEMKAAHLLFFAIKDQQ